MVLFFIRHLPLQRRACTSIGRAITTCLALLTAATGEAAGIASIRRHLRAGDLLAWSCTEPMHYACRCELHECGPMTSATTTTPYHMAWYWHTGPLIGLLAVLAIVMALACLARDLV